MNITNSVHANFIVNATEIYNDSETQRIEELDVCTSLKNRKVTVAEFVACFIAFITVLENFIILLAILKGPRNLRKPPYWFIANLASADMLTGVGVLLAVFLPIGSYPSSRVALKGFAVVTFIVSINSLLFVSFDRYLRIVRHADYKKFLNRKIILIMIMSCWVSSLFIFLVLPLLTWSCGSYSCCAFDGLCTCLRSQFGDSVCGNECSQSFVPFKKSYLLVGVIYFTLSVTAMAIFYAVIFSVVKKKQMNKGREVNLAKTLVITLGIFVVCWLPVVGLFIADLIIQSRSPFLLKGFDYALVPTVINSLLNPIIYSIRMPRMRVTIQRLILPRVCTGSGKRGTSYVSSTSMEKRSIRNFSIRRKYREKHPRSSVSSSSGLKDNMAPKNGQLSQKPMAEISQNES